MHAIALGLALLAALAIIAIGLLYLARPLATAPSFGLPPPGDAPGIAPWLRLKGVRDVASGLVVLAVMARGSAGMVGLVLLAEAAIPAGDMLVVLAARGSVRAALGVHGATALAMAAAAAAMLAGAS